MASGSNSTNVSEAICSHESESILFTTFCVTILLVLFACKLVHSALRHLDQPRIVSEFIVGFVIGNVPFMKGIVDGPLEDAFQIMEGILSALYMFVLGLEMEPLAILRPQGPEAKIAVAGIFSNCGIYFLIVTIREGWGYLAKFPVEKLRALAAFLVMISATSSPIVTRLITELKLSQTEIGRHAIRAGLANDLICTIIMGILVALRGQTSEEIIGVVIGVTIELIVALFMKRFLFNWVNNRNPEGKPFKGLDITIILLSTQFLCHSSMFFKYDAKLNSFLIGLALPRQGRISNFLISRINYVLTTFILPLYLSMAGIKVNFKPERGDKKISRRWARLVILTLLATIGKSLGTLVLSMRHGLHWLEAITLGVILSIKGYFQIFFSMHAKNRNLMNNDEFMVMVFMVVVSIVYVPFVVSFIVRKIRKIKEGKARLMGLQWYNPASQLRIVVGLQGVQNVTASISLIKMMAEGSEGGVLLYATDMIELTDENKAALVFRQGTNALMVVDDAVIKLRDGIGESLDAHLESSANTSEKEVGKGNIALRRNVAISSFSGMHDDICCNAQDNMVVLIVLPFHKSQKADGGMDAGHPGFRTVNENVLRHAPCSVGILIDRGLGRNNNISITSVSSPIHVVVVFIGGADDREALACAAIMAQHPTVRLLTIRIIADMEAMTADRPGQHVLAGIPNREIEMEVDDEYFAGFYEHYIKNGRVEYMEKHVENGAEAVQILRELEEECQLFIVGQGSERNSVLTSGLSEWAEYPELGPIGDILASSDFQLNASVLVLQQHNPARDSRYISKEFMVL